MFSLWYLQNLCLTQGGRVSLLFPSMSSTVSDFTIRLIYFELTFINNMSYRSKFYFVSISCMWNPLTPEPVVQKLTLFH